MTRRERTLVLALRASESALSRYESEPVITPSCQTFIPIQEGTISYRPLSPTLGTLQPRDGGRVIVIGSLGPVQRFGATDFRLYDPKRFLLTTEDGRVFQIDQAKGLERVTDLSGNRLSVTPGGVTSCPPGVSSGPSCKGIVFTRDGQGRIGTIKDPAGNALVYAFDASGDLVTHTDREANATSFTYEAAFPHHLKDIEDPLGRKPIKNTYFPDGRLESHTDAFGKTIQYAHSISARQEAVTDRTGAVRNGKGKKDRVVPIPARAVQALDAYLRDARPAFVKDHRASALLTSWMGKRLQPVTLQAMLKRRARAARLPVSLSPHVLRHSCATRLLKGGADIRHVQEILGHAHLDSTMRYTRVAITDLHKVIERCPSPRARVGPETQQSTVK